MQGLTLENHLFIIPVAFGAITLLGGFITLKFPPKKINPLYGYRTYRSMKNQERWNFAQLYASKEMIKIGIINIGFGVLGSVYFFEETMAMAIGLFVVAVSIFALIFRVENKLKKKFKD